MQTKAPSFGKVDLRNMNRGGAPAAQASEPKTLTPRDLEVAVTWEDPATGTVHRATLVSRILGRDEIARRDQWAAVMAGQPWECLPPAARARIWQTVTVTIQLREVPDWLLDALGEDDELLARLFQVTEAHTARYFRRDGGEGQEGQGGRRIEVVADGLAAPAAQ